jgi:NIPSNAP
LYEKGNAMKTLWGLPIMLCGVAAGAASADDATKGRASDTRVFELRTYYPNPGKMEALNARFRDHTCKLFEKHGMTIVGFWVPEAHDQADSKLVYLLAFPSRAASRKSWLAFLADPEWKAAKEASEKGGPLVKRLESVFLSPTDYSPMK